MTNFGKFLHEVEETTFETNTTSAGTVTIQQSARNELRKRGVEALREDLEMLYGADFDVVITKDGIVIVAENQPGDFTFSWELKNSIKSIDYDPFMAANDYDEAQADKENKRLQREAEIAHKTALLEEKRARKLAELEKKQSMVN